MVSHKLSGLSYEMVGDPTRREARTAVRATCHRCKRTEELSWNQGQNIPDLVAKFFRRRGWQFDPHHARGCICPACVNQPALRTDVDELLRKAESRMSVTPIKPDAPKVASDAAAAAARDLTPKEMRLVMSLLESHFDDQAGTFVRGWSDRRIAEELNLPMACVTRVRRDAFGEMKSTAEVEHLRQEIKKCFDKLVDLEARLNKLAADQH